MIADAECKSCPAPVAWRKHERTGKAALVDAYPVPGGNVALVGDDRYRIIGKDESLDIEAGRAPEPERFTLHFTTCPDADAWRGKR